MTLEPALLPSAYATPGGVALLRSE